MKMYDWMIPCGFIGCIILIFFSFKVSCDELGIQIFSIGIVGSILFGIGTILQFLGD